MIKKFIKNKFPGVYNFSNDLLLKILRYFKSYKIKRLIKLNQDNLKVVIGASGKYSEDWIPAEIDYFNILNIKHWEFFFNDASIDALLAEHVWEHLTLDEGMVAAKYCYKHLKPGGYIRLAVPDGYHKDDDYIKRVKPGGIGKGSDDHKVLYNFESFSNLFKEAGFNVYLLEYFDMEGEFHAVNWDDKKGRIQRSAKYDERNKNGNLIYTSVIIDAYK